MTVAAKSHVQVVHDDEKDIWLDLGVRTGFRGLHVGRWALPHTEQGDAETK
jgi:hypothetical protein